MTRGILEPHLRSLMMPGWEIHTFKGNAGIVLDTAPDNQDAFSVMVIGHADKIRMQVRSIGDDGKIWVNSDSMLPTTLIGHKVLLFSEDPERANQWRVIRGGTIEAIGAIHFADPKLAVRRFGYQSGNDLPRITHPWGRQESPSRSFGNQTGRSHFVRPPDRAWLFSRHFYGSLPGQWAWLFRGC